MFLMVMAKSQTIVGIVFMVLGILLSLTIIGAVYGVPMFIIGLFLVLYRNSEDEIEQIVETRKKGGRKK